MLRQRSVFPVRVCACAHLRWVGVSFKSGDDRALSPVNLDGRRPERCHRVSDIFFEIVDNEVVGLVGTEISSQLFQSTFLEDNS